jgi:hypothetical protein
MAQAVIYIWPVRTDWGLTVFERATGYTGYAYSRLRFPEKQDILVFYCQKHLIGSMPVKEKWRPTTPEERTKSGWPQPWKYMVGLDGAKKIAFKTPISVEEIADHIEILREARVEGKDLHDVCQVAPKMSLKEYNYILGKSRSKKQMRSKVSPGILKKLEPKEAADFDEDLSDSLKTGKAQPQKVRQTHEVYKRNQKLVKILKAQYKGRCQICGPRNKIETDSGDFYTEGHHKIPLGDKGYDDMANVVMLCPLCHKRLHYSKDRKSYKKKIKYSKEHKRLLKSFSKSPAWKRA